MNRKFLSVSSYIIVGFNSYSIRIRSKFRF